MIQPVIIFGAGPIGQMALDVFASNGIIVYGFLSDDASSHGKEIGEIPILGNTEDDGFLKLIGKKCDAFVATESVKERKALTQILLDRRHISPVNALHKESTVSIYAEIGHGNLILPGARIAAFAGMGSHCQIMHNAVVETNSKLGDYVQVGSGSIVGEGCTIGDHTFIGAGATILSGVKIGKNCSIGAGSVVLADVPAQSKVFGYPAKPV